MTMTTVRTTTTMTTELRPRAATLPGAALVVALAAVALGWSLRDDDRLVDPGRADARRAITVARSIVDGQLVDVRIDSDNGKWEVTLRRRDGDEHEVELTRALELLRIDYD